MQTVCGIVPVEPGFAPGMLAFIDCQARTLGAVGYQALAAPGSTASTLLTAALTMFVALIGFRMLLGEAPTVREGVLSLAKIGFVLALATSWPAFQALAYEVTFDAPAELAQEVGGPARLPGVAGDLPARLEGVDRAMERVAIAGVGQPPVVDGQLAVQPTAPPPFANFDAFALGVSRAVVLAAAIAAFGVVQLLAGLLLALGPLFVLFALFDATRGLTIGWIRGLVGAAVGAFGTTIVLSFELALLEPWLADLIARREAEVTIAGAPGQLLAAACVFAVLLTATLVAAWRVASGLTLPAGVVPQWTADRGHAETATPLRRDAFHSASESRSRAIAIADSVASMQRRERGSLERSVPSSSTAHRVGSPTFPVPSSSAGRTGAASVGPEAGRRSTRRVSAGAARRDRS